MFEAPRFVVEQENFAALPLFGSSQTTRIMETSAIGVALALLLVASTIVLLAVRASRARSAGLVRRRVLDAVEWRQFPLAQKTRVSHNTARYRFALPRDDEVLGLPVGQVCGGGEIWRDPACRTLRFNETLQHISVRREHDGKAVQRSYTPITLDTQDRGYFDLLIKVEREAGKCAFRGRFPNRRKQTYASGIVSAYMDTLEVGDSVWIRGPKGQYRYRPSADTSEKRSIGMIAGGTGIAPMFQVRGANTRDSR